MPRANLLFPFHGSPVASRQAHLLPTPIPRARSQRTLPSCARHRQPSSTARATRSSLASLTHPIRPTPRRPLRTRPTAGHIFLGIPDFAQQNAGPRVKRPSNAFFQTDSGRVARHGCAVLAHSLQSSTARATRPTPSRATPHSPQINLSGPDQSAIADLAQYCTRALVTRCLPRAYFPSRGPPHARAALANRNGRSAPRTLSRC